MPRYDIRCEIHGQQIVVASMSESNNIPCPTCGLPTKRVYNASGITIAIPRRFLNGVRKDDINE